MTKNAAPFSTRLALLVPALFLWAAACNSGGSGNASDSSLSTDPANAGELADVQRAINAAAPGATVEIGAGTYRGRLVVKKSVRIVGAGRGLTTIHGSTSFDDAVIEIRNGADIFVGDLAVSGPFGGIRVRESTRVVIESVTSNATGDAGIEVRESSDVQILACISDGNVGPGIRVRDDSTNVRIDSCEVRQNGDHGVRIRDTIGAMVARSSVTDNVQSGVRVRDSLTIELTANDISDNTEYGVRLRSSPLDPNDVRASNVIAGNQLGDVRVDE